MKGRYVFARDWELGYDSAGEGAPWLQNRRLLRS